MTQKSCPRAEQIEREPTLVHLIPCMFTSNCEVQAMTIGVPVEMGRMEVELIVPELTVVELMEIELIVVELTVVELFPDGIVASVVEVLSIMVCGVVILSEVSLSDDRVDRVFTI